MIDTKTNNIELKKINRNRIFRLLYSVDKISKQEISAQLQMSMPTVTQNLKNLEDQNLIVKVGTFESTGGRKPEAITYNPSAKYAIGIDITTNNIVAVVVDISGTIVESENLTIPFSDDSSYFQQVSIFIDNIVNRSSIDKDDILGVGIALPAIISKDKRSVCHASILGSQDGILGFENGTCDHFAKYIPYPCILCNDANAGGIAELWNNSATTNSVYISLNNTIGGAILFNNQLYFGENQRSGEFGHITIVNNGRRCYCGKNGCADAYLSANILSNTADGSLVNFFNYVNSGSVYHINVWNEYLDYLSLCVNNLRMLFDCNVIIGGYVGVYMDEHIEQLRTLVAKRNTYETSGGYMQACHYKMHATAVGAALIHIEEFIRNI